MIVIQSSYLVKILEFTKELIGNIISKNEIV